MSYKLRGYQKKAVKAGLKIIETKKNGLLVLAAGSGKSLVIADIIKKSRLKTVVLQPKVEILRQNLAKIQAFGVTDIGIFSASMNEKTIGAVTFATIGSVVKHKDKFAKFDLIIVDESHNINSKGGQYEEFITSIGKPVIGLTATPWRMRYYSKRNSSETIVESRFLTRTRPRIFSTIAHITQVKKMFDMGYLCPVKYLTSAGYDSTQIKSNSTGQGFNDESLQEYNKTQNIVLKIVDTIKKSPAKHILIFTQFRSESKRVMSELLKIDISCAEISGETKKKDRSKLISEFETGKIKCIVNVGVFKEGYDFPALDHIILGKPTKSLSLFYQMCGRGTRVFKGKKYCIITDLCDNVGRFGEINTFTIEDASDGRGMWRLKSNKGYQTGVDLNTGKDLETNQKKTTKKDKKEAVSGELLITFGKHRGIKLSELDENYMGWCIDNFDEGNKWKGFFKAEISRRNAG